MLLAGAQNMEDEKNTMLLAGAPKKEKDAACWSAKKENNVLHGARENQT